MLHPRRPGRAALLRLPAAPTRSPCACPGRDGAGARLRAAGAADATPAPPALRRAPSSWTGARATWCGWTSPSPPPPTSTRTLDYINISLDNGLWRGRCWLPNQQRVEIRRRIPQLDIPAGSVIRANMRVGQLPVQPAAARLRTLRGPAGGGACPRAEREAFPFEEEHPRGGARGGARPAGGAGGHPADGRASWCGERGAAARVGRCGCASRAPRSCCATTARRGWRCGWASATAPRAGAAPGRAAAAAPSARSTRSRSLSRGRAGTGRAAARGSSTATGRATWASARWSPARSTPSPPSSPGEDYTDLYFADGAEARR